MRCDRCGRGIPDDQSLTYIDCDGWEVCDQCLGQYHECDNCGTYVPRWTNLCDSCVYDEADEDEDEDTGGLVHDYGYQPRPQFHGTGPLFLGMELEISTRHCGPTPAEVADRELGTLGYLKHDSSIGTGFEAVTHPMTYAYAMEYYPWPMLRELRHAGAEATESCGLHVHVSRAGFLSPCHTYRWLKFIYRNSHEVQTIARRVNSDWAAFDGMARKQAKSAAKGFGTRESAERRRPARDGCGCDDCIAATRHNARLNNHGLVIDSYANYGRYVAINTQNVNTLEMRIFASSLKAVEVQAALGLAQASIEYTRQLSSNAIIHADGWGWKPFAQYVANDSQYAPLAREMERLSCAS